MCKRVRVSNIHSKGHLTANTSRIGYSSKPWVLVKNLFSELNWSKICFAICNWSFCWFNNHFGYLSGSNMIIFKNVFSSTEKFSKFQLYKIGRNKFFICVRMLNGENKYCFSVMASRRIVSWRHRKVSSFNDHFYLGSYVEMVFLLIPK